MKSKLSVVLFAALIATAFVVQPAVAQEGAACAGCQAKSEEACCGSEENADGQDVKGPNQEKCPVMGSTINKNVYTDYNGKRIYFCCAGCDKTFQKDPEKYMGKMKKEGVVLEATPCPVSGKPASTEIFTEYESEKVYFCCEGCKTKFEKSPEKYSKKS